jgi:hypothetical protein
VIDCIDFSKQITLLRNSLFIPFTDILATKYGIVGVDSNNKPYFNPCNVSLINNATETNYITKIVS